MPASEISTIVLQSHAPARLEGWLGRCCESVERWAAARGFTYERCGDELFDPLPSPLRKTYASQPVVLADLGRLLWMSRCLAAGYGRVIWCDADLLVFRDFSPVGQGDVFGRECWVQPGERRLRVYRKIHNAWMQFGAGSATLPFYIDRATALLERAEPPVVPQFIGPKLLTAWHNISAFAVEERAGMASPRVLAELLEGGDEALRLLRQGHGEALCAVNLCASLEDRESDGVLLRSALYHALIDGLLSGAWSGRI